MLELNVGGLPIINVFDHFLRKKNKSVGMNHSYAFIYDMSDYLLTTSFPLYVPHALHTR